MIGFNDNMIINSVVDELLHWVTAPREEYLNTLNQQVTFFKLYSIIFISLFGHIFTLMLYEIG